MWKIGSLRINDRSMEPTAMCLLGEDTREGLHNIRLDSDFLGVMPKAQETKTTTDELDDIKLKTFALEDNQVKRQPTEWGEYSKSYIWQGVNIYTV